MYGVTPAEYTTSNSFVQKVIEQSQYFKEGRIVILRGSHDSDTKSAYKSKKAVSKDTVTAPAQITSESTLINSGNHSDVPPGETTATETVDESGHADSPAPDSSATEIEVSCLQDAQAYLKEHFGIATYKVRTQPTVQAAAAEHGIRFVGI